MAPLKSVTGTGGDVIFNYKPNSTTKGASYNRYGAIKVTYHNNRCEHMIYLRQGYADTQLLDGGATWSLFNCTRKGFITEAPTQSGYFYQGGASDSYYTPWDVIYGNKHLNWKDKTPDEMQQ